MNELVTSSVEPSYLTPLALATAPFNQIDNSAFFFKSEQIEQRINLLQHLIRASDKVALLFAEKGSGKSGLLLQLQQAMGEDVRICRIDASSFTDAKELTLHCLRSFGIDENDIRLSSNHLELLQQRCFSLQNFNIKPLLLIDDADQLSEDNLTVILDWLSWQGDDRFLLQAILTAKNAMPELNTIHGRIQRVDLPTFTEAELSAYLAHRLAAAGYKGKLPFKPKILKKIFKKSVGNPELINQLAHQELLGIKPVTGSTFNLATGLKWLGFGLLITLLILLLVFQDRINTLFPQAEEATEFGQLSELVPESPITTVVADSESATLEVVEYSAPAEAESMEAKNIGPNTEEEGREELESLIAELSSLETEEFARQPEPENTIQTESGGITEDLVTPPKETGEGKESTPEEWVLQQDNNYYTFQMMGSWDEAKVVDFIEKYELSGDMAIFKSRRNGQIWYALIYGVFENKDVALQASNTWPEALKGLPKWLRRFDSVQQQIQK